MRYVLLAIGLGGCSLFDNSSSGSTDTVSLAAQTADGETGTVTLTSLATNSTQVALSTTGGTDSGTQTAVIRTGTCGSDGAIYAELNTVINRASITNVALDLSSLEGSKYYIDVHSSADVSTVVACGEIP